MSCCTAVNCVDGRVQRPVLRFLKRRFRSTGIDLVTDTAPNRILAKGNPPAALRALLDRIGISVEQHASTAVAIVAHDDCADNRVPKAEQFLHLRLAVERVRSTFPDTETIALWVDLKGRVEEIAFRTIPARK